MITRLFTVTKDSVATDADSTPTGVCYVNGTATADAVTVTNLATGRYKASVDPATVVSGDLVEVVVSVTVDGDTQELVVVTETVGAAAAVDKIDGIAAELLNDRLYTIDDGTEEVLDTDDSVLVTITPTGSIAFTGAGWTNASKYITKAGAFADYVWKSGDVVTLTAGTGVTLGQYTISSKIDSGTIELATDINGVTGDIADASIAGTIATGRVLRRRS